MSVIRIIGYYWFMLLMFDIVVGTFGLFDKPSLQDRMFCDLRFGGLLLLACIIHRSAFPRPNGDTP